MDQLLFWLVPAASVLALCFAWYFHRQMMKESEGTPQMVKIAAAVRKGAMSYLRQQYKIVGWVFLGLVILFSIMAYGFGVQNSWVPIAFLTGGFFSGLSGFLGMKTATYASARTANAARNSLNAGLRIAFRSGAVMGLVVVGLGLLDISFWYLLLNAVIPVDVMTPTHKLCIITTTMLTFGIFIFLRLTGRKAKPLEVGKCSGTRSIQRFGAMAAYHRLRLGEKVYILLLYTHVI